MCVRESDVPSPLPLPLLLLLLLQRYGHDGCRVEDPTCSELCLSKQQDLRSFDGRYGSVQYPLTLEGGASKTTDYARKVLAGEFIQHLCKLAAARLCLQGEVFW